MEEIMGMHPVGLILGTILGVLWGTGLYKQVFPQSFKTWFINTFGWTPEKSYKKQLEEEKWLAINKYKRLPLNFWKWILCIMCPPLAVLPYGLHHSLIATLYCALFWLPGVAYAVDLVGDGCRKQPSDTYYTFIVIIGIIVLMSIPHGNTGRSMWWDFRNGYSDIGDVGFGILWLIGLVYIFKFLWKDR